MALARIAAGAALAAALSGCLPIPYALEPGFRGSRSDLGDAVPAFIVPGQTARAEVLQRLGAPEVEALDSSWFYYESDYLIQNSGVLLLIGGPGGALPVGASGTEAKLHRRLFLRFGPVGEVADADFQTEKCVASTGAPAQPCRILARGVELREERRRAVLDALSTSQATRFDGALWKDGEGLPSMWANLRDDPLNCAWARKGFGTVLVLEDSILFVPPQASAQGPPPVAVRVERAGLAKIEPFGPSLVNVYETSGIQMTRKDGRLVSFTLCGARGQAATDRLHEVLGRLTATPR